MTISERLRLFGDEVSYRFPRFREVLRPIWHFVFLNRYNRGRDLDFKANAVDAMAQFDKCMRDNNISYSLAFGSMLGAVREKGVIKHDADMDTNIFADENPDRVKKCLEAYGFRQTRKFLIDGGKLGREETYEYENCPIDIYWVYNVEGVGNCCSSYFPYGEYPTVRISMREVGKVQGLRIKLPISKEVKRVPFGDQMLPIPINAEDFLKQYYGDNYMIPDPNWSWRECSMISMWNDAVATYEGIH